MKKVILSIVPTKAWLILGMSVLLTANTNAQILNGSFEQNIVTDQSTGFNTYQASTNPPLSNWAVSNFIIDLHYKTHHNMGCPPGGLDNHIDLNTFGKISQSNISLVSGRQYSVTYWYSVHALLAAGQTANALVQVSIGGVNHSNIINTNFSNRLNWTQGSFTFTSSVTGSASLSFEGTGSDYGSGGVLIDMVSINDVTPPPNCDNNCFWRLNGNAINSYLGDVHNRLGTTNNHAVRFITNNIERGIMTHSGIFGFGTMSPSWNFRATIENRNAGETHNTRNGINVNVVQPNLGLNGYGGFGNGVLVSTNSLAATKALAVDGNGSNRAIIFGNGMSWFKNRMQLGGTSPTNQVADDNSTGPILVVNGTGLINGLNLTSDKRFKQNIKSIEKANEIVSKLNPVTYDFDIKKFPERNFETKNSYGFIAQELKEVLPNIVNVEQDQYLSVNYIALIPILTQAIKEQKTQIEELKNTISKLQTQQPTSTQEVELNGITQGIILSQNVPNPFTTDTRISYVIPYGYKVAKLGIYDLNGQEIKLVNLASANGEVVIQGGNLKPGIYIYTLIIDGKTVASKKMTLTSN